MSFLKFRRRLPPENFLKEPLGLGMEEKHFDVDFVTYTLIVDDIVHPDGSTAMACLGGGGPQTAFGIKLWSSDSKVALAAGVGEDLPFSCREWLESMGILTECLIVKDLPTLRAWQIFEEDGRRTQVWRVPMVDGVWSMLRPDVKTLPFPFQKSRAYHVGVHPSGKDVPFIQNLKSTGAEVVSIEPYTRAEEIVSHQELRDLIGSSDIFSPNEEEAWSLVGPGTPEEVVQRLVEFGGKVICLRMGKNGALVHQSDSGETYFVPAFYTVLLSNSETSRKFLSKNPDEFPGIVDQTGCGNSFCGGFLAGWVKTGDLLTSAVWGSVAASLMIEHEGVPPIRDRRKEAIARAALVREESKVIEFKNLL